MRDVSLRVWASTRKEVGGRRGLMSDHNKFLHYSSACLAGHGRFSLSVRLTALKVSHSYPKRSAILPALSMRVHRRIISPGIRGGREGGKSGSLPELGAISNGFNLCGWKFTLGRSRSARNRWRTSLEKTPSSEMDSARRKWYHRSDRLQESARKSRRTFVACAAVASNPANSLGRDQLFGAVRILFPDIGAKRNCVVEVALEEVVFFH